MGSQFGTFENIPLISNADRGLKTDTISLLKSMNHMAGALLSMEYGYEGICSSINTASSSGAVAIGEAYRYVKYGEQDFMAVGVADFNLHRPFF